MLLCVVVYWLEEIKIELMKPKKLHNLTWTNSWKLNKDK